MPEIVRYTYRLRPGTQAERALMAEWHRCRYLWNEAVHQERSRRPISKGRLGKLLTEARRANGWLRDGWQNTQAETLNTYALALDHSCKVKGRGRPKPKRRKVDLPSLPFSRNGFTIKNGRLRLPKGTIIPVVWSRDLPSDPSSVRVYRDNLGHWYASFVVHCDARQVPDADGGIGIDWGVKTTATTTDPAYDLPYGGYRKRCAAELAKAQRKMARRHRSRGHAQTGGYRRAKREAAALQKKAARQNTHAARTWAKRVVDNHQTIAVEDFRPQFLAKSTMARKARDAAIGAAKRELIERGMRAGRKVVLVPPAYTTMTCSECGEKQVRLGLAERTFRCTDCGYTASRDRNAARTILAMAERGHAGADDVRHPSRLLRVAGGMRSEPEIPRP